MIFHTHRAIFIHPGKTAGSSIEKALGHDPFASTYAGSNGGNTHILFGLDKDINIYMHHGTAAYVKSKVPKKVWEEYYKFGIVRNPYTRILSVYYYLEDIHAKRYGSFKDFVLKLPDIIKNPHLMKGSHYIPQHVHMYIEDEYAMDFVIRKEDIVEDYPIVSRHIGTIPVLPHINHGHGRGRPDKPMEEVYTKEMVSVMQDVYSKDFEAFAYDPDPSRALNHLISV